MGAGSGLNISFATDDNSTARAALSAWTDGRCDDIGSGSVDGGPLLLPRCAPGRDHRLIWLPLSQHAQPAIDPASPSPSHWPNVCTLSPLGRCSSKANSQNDRLSRCDCVQLSPRIITRRNSQKRWFDQTITSRPQRPCKPGEMLSKHMNTSQKAGTKILLFDAI